MTYAYELYFHVALAPVFICSSAFLIFDTRLARACMFYKVSCAMYMYWVSQCFCIAFFTLDLQTNFLHPDFMFCFTKWTCVWLKDATHFFYQCICERSSSCGSKFVLLGASSRHGSATAEHRKKQYWLLLQRWEIQPAANGTSRRNNKVLLLSYSCCATLPIHPARLLEKNVQYLWCVWESPGW